MHEPIVDSNNGQPRPGRASSIGGFGDDLEARVEREHADGEQERLKRLEAGKAKVRAVIFRLLVWFEIDSSSLATQRRSRWPRPRR